MKFRLGEEDRQTLGCPEWIVFDENRLRVSEARQIRELTGIRQADWGAELEGGNTDMIAAFVWLALKRTGITVAYEDLDFDLAAAEMATEDEDLGKASTTS